MRKLCGLTSLVVGLYLLLNSIIVTSTFGLGTRLISFGGSSSAFGVTTGVILIPFIAGIILIAWDYTKKIGWIVAGLSLVALIAGVITSVRFVIRPMSSFELLMIVALVAIGAGFLIPRKTTSDVSVVKS